MDERHGLPPGNANPIIVAMEQAQDAENAIRHHERNRRGGDGDGRPGAGAGAVRRRPEINDDERQQAELLRFLEMAQRDEEDDWDSDELGDDDEGFLIQ